MVLGIISTVSGGILVTLLETRRFQLTSATLSIPSVIVTVICAIIDIFIWKLLTRRASYLVELNC